MALRISTNSEARMANVISMDWADVIGGDTAIAAGLALKANIADPVLTGSPRAPTAAPGNNSTQIATTAYADAGLAAKANVASPTFTGTITTPNISVGTTLSGAARADLEPTIVCTGTFGASNEAFRILATRSGNATGGSARLVDIFDLSNSVTTTDANGEVSALFISSWFSGSAFAHHGIHVDLRNTAVTSPTGGFGWTVGMQADVTAAYGYGGSAGAGNQKGSLQGITTIVAATSGATFLQGLGGAELDLCLHTGASANAKVGLNIVSGDGTVGGSDLVKAITPGLDSALQITSAVTQDVGFHQGITIGSPGFGWPIHSDGTIIKIGATSNTQNCDIGIDFTNGVFASYAFKTPGYSLTGAGIPTFASTTAIPAGGTAGTGIKVSSTSNMGIFFGSNTPTLSAAKGSLYLRSDGTTTNNRMYINTDGSTTWTAVTTVA